MNARWCVLFLAASIGVVRAAGAEVTDRTPAGFTVKTVVPIAATTDRVFDKIADAVDTVIGDQLRRLRTYVERSRR